jgi:tRNA (cytidine32/guanosine34-2'-O)-methyltransferase
MYCTESFVLCQQYTPPEGYQPTMINPMADLHYGTTAIHHGDSLQPADKDKVMTGPNALIVPFLACGDLSGYDADTNYELGAEYSTLTAVQLPINPPYKHAVMLKKHNLLATPSSQTSKASNLTTVSTTASPVDEFNSKDEDRTSDNNNNKP